MSKNAPTTFPSPAIDLANQSNVVISGILYKQDRKMGLVWRKRFFLLLLDNNQNCLLYYFKSPNEMQSISHINIKNDLERIEENLFHTSHSSPTTTISTTNTNTTGSTSSATPRGEGSEGKSKLNLIKRKFGFKLILKSGREYLLYLEDEMEYKKWLNYLNLAIKGTIGNLINKNEKIVTQSLPNLSTAKFKVVHHNLQQNLQQQNQQNSLQQNNNQLNNIWLKFCLDTCQVGCKVIKFPYLGKCSGLEKKRFIQLSKDKKIIRWGCQSITKSSDKMTVEEDLQINKKILNRNLKIENIKEIIYGTSSNTLQRYQHKLLQNNFNLTNCLSIQLNSSSSINNNTIKKQSTTRTIDLMFESETDVMGWYIYLNVYVLKKDIEKVLNEFRWLRLYYSLKEKQLSFTKIISNNME
ncbi:hypothetical protein ABK040_010127 [Willaertia magna]